MAEGKSGRSSVVFIFILLTQILAVMVFVPSDFIDSTRVTEIRWLETIYFDDTIIWIADTSYWLYDILVQKTGLADTIRWAFTPGPDNSEVSGLGRNVFFPYLQDRGVALEALAHLMIIRAVAIAVWFPLYVIILMPSLVDGLIERRIKRETFSYPSPMKHRMGLKMDFFVIFLIIAGLLSPIPIPPLILPMTLAVSLAVTGIMVVGNLPKKL